MASRINKWRSNTKIYIMVGKEIPAEIISESIFLSKHTGRELKYIQVSLVEKGKEANERLLETLNTGRDIGIDSTDGKGNVLSKWRMKNNSYNYSDDNHISNYYHSIELEEMEDLKMTTLEIAGLILNPYYYDEKFDEDALIIEAKVKLSGPQFTELKEVMKKTDYFPVIRHGINEEPREMRFGSTSWSEEKDNIKHEILLVEKSYDNKDRKSKVLYEPQMSNIQTMLATDTEILEELISTLTAKNLLSIEDVNQIRLKASDRLWERKREFDRMKDIDKI